MESFLSSLSNMAARSYSALTGGGVWLLPSGLWSPPPLPACTFTTPSGNRSAIVSFLIVGCMFVSVVLNCMNVGQHLEFCLDIHAVCDGSGSSGIRSEPPTNLPYAWNAWRIGIRVTLVLPCDWLAHTIGSEFHPADVGAGRCPSRAGGCGTGLRPGFHPHSLGAAAKTAWMYKCDVCSSSLCVFLFNGNYRNGKNGFFFCNCDYIKTPNDWRGPNVILK